MSIVDILNKKANETIIAIFLLWRIESLYLMLNQYFVCHLQLNLYFATLQDNLPDSSRLAISLV